MNPKTEKKMEKIEKIFTEAETVLGDLEILEPKVVSDRPPGLDALSNKIDEQLVQYDIEDAALVKDGNVFELDDLKKDFLMVKRNLHKMIRRGQTMMDTTQYMDLEDSTAGKIMAIAQLSTSISMNLKMLIEIYKDIVDIEKTRRPEVPGVISGAVSGDVNQNIIFSGDTAELMRYIKGK